MLRKSHAYKWANTKHETKYLLEHCPFHHKEHQKLPEISPGPQLVKAQTLVLPIYSQSQVYIPIWGWVMLGGCTYTVGINLHLIGHMLIATGLYAKCSAIFLPNVGMYICTHTHTHTLTHTQTNTHTNKHTHTHTHTNLSCSVVQLSVINFATPKGGTNKTR